MRPLLWFVLSTFILSGQIRQVAITFDDLPRGGDSGGRDLQSIRRMTEKLLTALRGVPVTAFVNAGRAQEVGDAGLQTILKLWRDQGASLGNHTYSHPDLNNTPLDQYTADILRGEPAIIAALGGVRPVFFRHPFLHAGKDLATKRGLESFLTQHGYRVAPVTLDNSDWLLANVYAGALKNDKALAARVQAAYVPYMESILAFFEERSKELVGREFAQVLLVHANQLNADTMPALLDMMRRRGYKFINLDEALRDEAYQLRDDYAGPGGFSWIHRWSKTKGMPAKGEPDEPKWIADEYRKRQATPP
jgi:peptidoglycan-N-acetylglucosamine deacetylase